MTLKKRTAGPIVLLGSGETSPSGRSALDYVLSQLSPAPQVMLLETPSGFEPNSSQVIGRVADFITLRLQNYLPQVTVVPAKRKNTAFSPEDPEIVAPLLEADLIFMGPGSPTYAVRQLKDTLAWQYVLARHRLGATLVLSSAAVVAISVFALPVYEIYKVGEDLHWKPGLDLFGMYGLPLLFVPHWNNQDGGAELDTSRCYMGKDRFAQLMQLLPPDLTVLGIDENTALVIEPEKESCRVIGLGVVTLLHTGHHHAQRIDGISLEGAGLAEVAQRRHGHIHQYQSGATFSLDTCCPMQMPEAGEGIPDEVWRLALKALRVDEEPANEPPPEVINLLERRAAARRQKDWALSDRLRDQIKNMGWQILDTPDGPKLEELC